MSKIINSFKYIPILLFRLNAGKKIKLREHSVKRSKSFDVFAEAGVVHPKALDPSSYSAPNGASMRPLSDFQTGLVETFKGSDVVVYAVPEGTSLPDDLILVHEYGDHYSLQPATEMTLEELNKKITDFLKSQATVYTRDQWLATFRAGGPSGSSVAGPSSSSQPSSSGHQWVWSDEYERYYRVDKDGKYIWAPETEGGQAGKSSKKNKKKH